MDGFEREERCVGAAQMITEHLRRRLHQRLRPGVNLVGMDPVTARHADHPQHPLSRAAISLSPDPRWVLERLLGLWSEIHLDQPLQLQLPLVENLQCGG